MFPPFIFQAQLAARTVNGKGYLTVTVKCETSYELEDAASTACSSHDSRVATHELEHLNMT